MPRTLQVTLDGWESSYDVPNPGDTFRLSDAEQLFKKTRQTRGEWFDSINAREPQALRFLVWWVRTTLGETVDYSELDFDVVGFDIRVVGSTEETETDDESDPSPPSSSPESTGETTPDA